MRFTPEEILKIKLIQNWYRRIKAKEEMEYQLQMRKLGKENRESLGYKKGESLSTFTRLFLGKLFYIRMVGG